MCCFSKAVQLVANTTIFARGGKDGRQFLVYSMRVKAAEELAMILPIPTPKASAEDAVKFLNLEKYEKFFDELQSGFPVPKSDGTRGPTLGGGKGLAVVEVGSFVASFVPTVKDFARLDAQFRLPGEIWDKLPQYKDWGFAVFQLKKGEKKIHPMAFDFPRANPRKLFFPTVHIHDGAVHDKAKFDHILYAQGNNIPMSGWMESPQPAGMFMTKLDQAHGIVDPKAHVHRRIMIGNLKNEDILI
jgi:hypothetical protein